MVNAEMDYPASDAMIETYFRGFNTGGLDVHLV